MVDGLTRRFFLALFGALAALPVFGSRLRSKGAAQVSPWYEVPFGGHDFAPVPEHILVRALEPIEAGSLVVCEGGEAHPDHPLGIIPHVRKARGRPDVQEKLVGVTSCHVDKLHYTVLNTRYGLVRIEGPIV